MDPFLEYAKSFLNEDQFEHLEPIWEELKKIEFIKDKNTIDQVYEMIINAKKEGLLKEKNIL